jgi:hypothetical protein
MSMPNNVVAGHYFGYAFVTFGLFLVAVASYVLVAALRLRASAQRAEGTVVRLVKIERSDSEGDPILSIHPVVAFPTQAGQVQFQGRFGTNRSAFSVGDKVTVLYYPDKPQDAQIKGFAQQFLLPLILFGTGSMVILVGSLVLVASRT